MKKLKCLAIVLLVGTLTSLAQATEIEPLYFDYISGGAGLNYDSLQDAEWDYLMKFKMFGQEGIMFNGTNIKVPDESGWFGTSTGGFTLKNGNHVVGGPILIGNNIRFSDGDGSEVFSTGPVRVLENLYYANWNNPTDNPNIMAGPICIQKDIYRCENNSCNASPASFINTVPYDNRHFNSGNLNGNPAYDNYKSCPDSIPEVKTSLKIPRLSLPAGVSYENAMTAQSSNSVIYIDVPPAESSKDIYDRYIEKISLYAESKLIVRMQPGGRLTRIFLKDGIFFENHGRIQIMYMDDVTKYSESAGWSNATGSIVNNKDYNGNLLFYTTAGFSWAARVSTDTLQGTFITTGLIQIKQQMTLAGQLLADSIFIDANFDGSGFIYVQFNPPELNIDPQLLNEGRWPETGLDSIVPIHLDTVPVTDVKFSYCFAVEDTTRVTVPAHVASVQDFQKTQKSKFPVCGVDTAHVLIKEGKLEPTDDTKIYINVIKDTLTEGDEDLTLKIFGLAGAVMPGNKKSGEFVLKITDMPTPKFNNDDTDPYPQDENTPNTPVADGDIVKIIALKNMNWERKDSILVEMSDLTPGSASIPVNDLFEFVVDSNPATRSVQTIIRVIEGTRIDYEQIPHTYDVVLTLKHKKEDPANPGDAIVYVVDTLIRSINIQDINEAPTIYSIEEMNVPFVGSPTPFTLYPNENLNNGDSVGVVHASDPDIMSNGRFDHLEYSIESANPVPFKMNGDTIVVDGDNKLNYEVQNEYTFDVVVTNCEWDVVNQQIIPPAPGNSCLEDRQTVTVKLQDVNEPPVIIKDDVDHYDVDENKYATGDYIVEFEIQDVDEGDLDNNIVVSMSDDNGTRVDTLFRVGYDKTTHKIYVQVIDSTKIDFEKVKPVHKVTITVSDGDLQDTVIRTINIIDVNETPTITGVTELNNDYTGTKEDFTLYPKENLKDGDSVGVVLATDPDFLSNGKYDHLEFSVVSANPVPFKMKGDTIVVDGDGKLDYEGTNVYTFDVKVTNCEWDVANNVAVQGGSCLEDVKTVTVKLQDVNEPPIIIKDDVDHYDVDENKYATGAHIAEFEIQDVDAGNLDSKIQVSVSDDNSTGVESLFKFGYDNATHKVYVSVIDSASIDYESILTEHKVTITVTDGEFQDTIIRAINIIDVNEAPNIDQIVDATGNTNVLGSGSVLKPFENMKNDEIIGTIVASDPDSKHVMEFGHLEYILVDDPTNPVPFKMIGPSIAVADSSAMNAELNKNYEFKVVVKNCEWDASLNAYSTTRCLEDEETIRVQIQNVPEDPVIVCKAGDTNCNGPFVAIENSKGDSVIHEFIVRDEDEDQLKSLKAEVIDTNSRGADTLFKAVVEYDATLNDYVVKIEVIKDGVLDYEKLDSTYTIKLKVTDDDALSDSIVRVINIRDVNEVPNIDQIVDANGNADVLGTDGILKPFENMKENDTIGVIVASDPDIKHVMEFGYLEYILVDNPSDPLPFKMIGSAIVVKDTSAMNAELDKEYTFDVKVRNCEWDTTTHAYSTDRCLEDVETIRVQIQNVPEYPIISCREGDTNCEGPYKAIENSKGDSVIHEFVVSDEDKGQVETLNISLRDDNGRGADTLFKAVIEKDATTGDYILKIEVSKDGVLDYEKLDSAYSITVKVTDKDNLADSISREIKIVDVNEAPTLDPFNKTIEENLPDSAVVGKLVAADPDIKNTAFSQLTYRIIDENIPFWLDSNIIRVGNSSELDYEKNPSFSFNVEVSDGVFSDTALVTIKLKDVDENPKIIIDDDDDGDDDDDSLCVAHCDTTNRGSGPDSVFTVGIDENRPTGTVVLQYVVSDEDRDEVKRLTPTLKDNNSTGVDSLFKIGMKTVADTTWLVVSVKDSSKLDFEHIKQLHEVTIIVTDSTGLADSIVRRIQVRDVNEAPTLEPFEKTIDENLPDSAVVGALVAADPDTAKAFSKLTYTILDEGVPFVLDSNVIKVSDKTKLDYEKTHSFSFNVEVSDGVFKDTALVTIKLKDVNESPKIITDDDDDGDDDTVDDSLCVANCQDTTNRGSGDEHGKNALTVGVDENSPAGTVVLQYYVYDEDIGDLEKLIPSLNQISASVEGSSADELFDIKMVPDGNRMKIVVSVKENVELDYEELRKAETNTDPDPEYTVRIIVSDQGSQEDALKDTIIRIIRVQDVNESPLFTVETCEIAENNQIGDSLGRIEHPSDIDSMSRIVDYYDNQFRLVEGDTALFDLKYGEPIDGRPNIIVVAKVVFDCESEEYRSKCGVDGAFHVVIDYFDKNDTTIKTTHNVPITLIDVNEPPKITTDSVEVKENVEKGTVVDTIKATDPDVYDSVLTYTLVEDESGCFDVSKSGVITVKVDNCPALDYEKNKELPIKVKVTDNGTDGEGDDTLSDTKTIYVKITDVNEAPKLDDKEIHVSEDTKVETPVDTVTASDPDKDPKYNELVYRIIEGDTSVFEIDSITGVITLKDSLDYETKPEYKLVIEVDDGEFTDKATVTVKVDNVIETPKVEITRAETTDSSWTNPDTIYINTSEICIEWAASERKSGKVLLDSAECGIKLDEGENTIIRKFEDPTMDYPGYDTLVVYVSTATPIVTVRKVTDELADPNIFTVVEQSAKADTAFYVNDPSNELIVTVTDPVSNSKESFTVNVDLDTVSVPTKTFKTLNEITEFGIALNDNPSSGVTHTPVNGEKIAVTYTEKVDGKEVVITYYTDNKGELLENADGVVEMTVTYTEKINGVEVKLSYQADAVTGAVIKTSGGYVKSDEAEPSSSSSGKSSGKSSSSKGGKDDKSKKSENEVVFTVSYEVTDANGNVMTVSYGVDAEGNIVKNEYGCVGYEVGYTYTNKYGNSSTQSIFVVLDQVPPQVKILYPTEGEVVYSNFIDVKWTVDIGDGRGPIVQDTLVTQSLNKGGNPIVRFYRDKAGNMASDTVRIIMKNAKDVDIAVEQPVTEISKDKVEEYYAANEPEEGETFAVSIYNPKTDKEIETLVGGDFESKKGSGDEPYPGLPGHLGPTLGVETKVPSVNAVGGLATLDDIVKDGLVMLEDVDANNGAKMPVDEYVEKFCSDEFAEKVGSDLSKANLYRTKMYVKIWIYTTLGSFVDYYTFTQDLDNPDYANDAGLLTLYFEMKPDRDGNVRTQDGRLMATGAYIYKTEVEMKMELRCSLPPFDVDKKTGEVKGTQKSTNARGSTRSVTEDMLKSFGYKRPEKK